MIEKDIEDVLEKKFSVHDQPPERTINYQSEKGKFKSLQGVFTKRFPVGQQLPLRTILFRGETIIIIHFGCTVDHFTKFSLKYTLHYTKYQNMVHDCI